MRVLRLHMYIYMQVAHAFYLGTKYSEPFNATFIDNTGQKK